MRPGVKQAGPAPIIKKARKYKDYREVTDRKNGKPLPAGRMFYQVIYNHTSHRDLNEKQAGPEKRIRPAKLLMANAGTEFEDNLYKFRCKGNEE